MSDDWEKELKRLEERMAERRAKIRQEDQENSDALREGEERRKAEERREAVEPEEGDDSDKSAE